MSTTTTEVNIRKRNPFYEPPLPRAFYHPSSPKSLSKHYRKIALSPTRKDEGRAKTEFTKSPEEEMFLSGSHRLSGDVVLSPQESSSKFDESWPSSERPSLGDESIRGSQFDFDRFLSLKKRLDFREKDSPDNSSINPVKESTSVTGESTLAKYVERFRKGEPLSRREREKHKGSSVKDFWWLSSSPTSSKTQKKEQSPDSLKYSQWIFPGVSAKKDAIKKGSVAAQISSVAKEDEKTRLLQEKAERLLERRQANMHGSVCVSATEEHKHATQSSSSSEASTGPVVSTEGLGSSPSSASVVTDRSEEQPYRPSFTRFVRESTHPPQPGIAWSRGSQLRPEDDILYQWRLKRKMELAHDSAHLTPTPAINLLKTTAAQPTGTDSKLLEFRQRLSDFGNQHVVLPVPQTTGPSAGALQSSQQSRNVETSAPEAAETNDTLESSFVTNPPIASPTLHRRQKMKLKEGEPTPHLHLMCDLLPCPHQRDYDIGETRSSLKGETEINVSEEKPGTAVRYTQYLEAEQPDSDRKTRKQIKLGDLCNKDVECNHPTLAQRKPQGSDVIDSETHQKRVRHKNSVSPVLDEALSDNRFKKTDPQLHEGPAGKAPKPKISEISKHSTQQQLDNAIGEVVKDYFFDSQQSIVTSSAESPPSASVSPVNSTTAQIIPSADTSDCFSDGEEFSDDSLLQHLRQQRTLYENQLREIDDILAELEAGT